MKLTQEEVKRLFIYDSDTGIFTRRISRRGYGCKEGTVVGHLTEHGYLNFSYRGKQYYLHRVAFLYMEGYLPENFVDHINGNRQDNRYSNLREVSSACNIRNSKMLITNTTGVKGVSYNKKTCSFTSRIYNNNKPVYLGIFKEFKDAVIARWYGEVKYSYPTCNTTSSAYIWLIENDSENFRRLVK